MRRLPLAPLEEASTNTPDGQKKKKEKPLSYLSHCLQEVGRSYCGASFFYFILFKKKEKKTRCTSGEGIFTILGDPEETFSCFLMFWLRTTEGIVSWFLILVQQAK